MSVWVLVGAIYIRNEVYRIVIGINSHLKRTRGGIRHENRGHRKVEQSLFRAAGPSKWRRRPPLWIIYANIYIMKRFKGNKACPRG